MAGMALWVSYGACQVRHSRPLCLWWRVSTRHAVQFQAFKLLRGAGDQEGASPVVSFAAGAAAGAIATSATYPLDLLRTRMAGQGVPKVRLGPMR